MNEPVLDVFDIQGNVAPGFRLPHQCLVGFGGNAASLKEVLKYFAPRLTNMQQAYEYHRQRKKISREKGVFGPMSFKLTAESHVTWFNIAFGKDLLKELQFLSPLKKDASFAAGMYNRSSHLGDPKQPGEPGHKDGWKFGKPGKTIDLLVIAGSNDEYTLQEQVSIIHTKFRDRIIYSEMGNRLENDTEHFGFKDGVSQPGVRGFVYNDNVSYLEERSVVNASSGPEFFIPGAVLLWPGEFIFGYPGQSSNDYRMPDPSAPEQDPMLKNGSFMVVRRLLQNVAAFYEETARISAELQQQPDFQKFDAEYVRAKMVGRFKNGVPLAKEDTRGGEPFDLFEDNNFLYKEGAKPAQLTSGGVISGSQSDFMGLKCPMFAHIRKVNPRDLSTDQGSETDTLKLRVLRRGIPFGPPYDFSNPGNPVNTEDRGLFFISYQANIAKQFELLQNRWANTPVNPEENKGFDMIIGHNNQSNDHKIWSLFENEQFQQKKVTSINKWVIPSGGEYLFCPSISVVQGIINVVV